MIPLELNGLVYYQFESLRAQGLIQGVFTRLGGVSAPPWDSLNLGGTVGDDPVAVRENLDRLVGNLGYSVDQLVQVHQIHSAKVVRADRPMDALEKGDGIITDRPDLLLLMRFADCVPLLYYDPGHRAVAIAHAGWKGTLKGIAAQVVKEMSRQFGSRPEMLIVGIGPSIGPDHYLVGDNVVEGVEELFPNSLDEVLIEDVDGVKFNLWRANQILLEREGVNQIEVGSICTACNLDHWYSHRAENGRTGRFAAVIGLAEE